jgi:TPR repeat protein
MNLAIVTIALMGCCIAVWHWRSDLRGFMAAGLAHASDDQSHLPAGSSTGDSAQPTNTQASAPKGQPNVDAGISPARVGQSQAVIEPASLRELAKPASLDDAYNLETEGERYLYGTGVPSNCLRAHRDLMAADDLGDAKADTVLGTMYATGHCVGRDLPQAYQWFSKARQRNPADPQLKQSLDLVWNGMTADERLAVHAKAK